MLSPHSELNYVSMASCLYGDQDRRDRVLYEYHTFAIIASFSLAVVILLGNNKLRRIYLPLSNVVQISILLQIFSSVLYFAYYPYSDTKGNCSEIMISRLYLILIMFGELHQIYFIANVLGFSQYRFFSFLSLPTALRSASFLVVVFVILSSVIKHVFMVIQDIWALFIISLQLFFLRKAKFMTNHEDTIIDVTGDAISLFEALSWLQLIPLVITLIDRILELVTGQTWFASLDSVLLIFECLSNYLFYLKTLVIREKAAAFSAEVTEV